MSGKHWLLIGGLSLIAVVAWTVAASQLFLIVCGLWSQISDPITRATAWWVYAFSPYAAYRSIKLTLALTAAVPAALLAAPVVLALRRGRLRWPFFAGVKPVERGDTDNHGHADYTVPGKHCRFRHSPGQRRPHQQSPENSQDFPGTV
jgi:hypothetical protein